MSENPDQKVKIKFDVSGVKIELECLPSQVENTVENVLKGVNATDVAKIVTNRGDRPPLSEGEEIRQKDTYENFVKQTDIPVSEIDENDTSGETVYEAFMANSLVYFSRFLKKRKMTLEDIEELRIKNPKKYQRIMDEFDREVKKEFGISEELISKNQK